MRHRLLGALGVGMAALATVGAMTLDAHAASTPSPLSTDSAHAYQPSPPPARTCYAQRDHDAFAGIISQNFDPAFDLYDAQAVDDFVLRETCRRPVLDVDGTYGEGEGSADSFNVTIYRASKHGPGSVERHLKDVPYTQPCGEGGGCTQIALRGKLEPGHWWLSVQANVDFSQTGTQWQWWTNQTVRHTGAMWRNPGDGFTSGCTRYTDLITCVGEGVGMGGDLSFSISSS